MDIVEIFDTTLRDGEQATQGFKNKKSKYVLARAERKLGVDTIEAGYPSSSKEDFDCVKEIAKKIRGPNICGLTRTIPEEIERTWDAIKYSDNPTMHIFTVNVNKDSLESYNIDPNKIFSDSLDAVKYARKLMNGKGRIEFSAQNVVRALVESQNKNLRSYNGTAIDDFVLGLYESMVNSGVRFLNIPDTEGYALPPHVAFAVNAIKERIPKSKEVILSFHGHNDLGLGTANTITAIENGVRQAEVCINGIGERAGNVALEEVVQILAIHGALKVKTNIDRKQLNYVSRLVEEHSGIPIPYNKAVVGENAFRHSSGIHQDGKEKGRKKGRAVYELCDPADVGWTGESHQITARSGKKGLQMRYGALGYDMSLKTIESVIMKKIKVLADEVGVLNDLDLRVIADDHLYKKKQNLVFMDHGLNKVIGKPTYDAQVQLKNYRKKVTSNFTSESDYWKGGGPTGAVNAILSAIDSIIDLGDDKPKLVSYLPINIGKTHATTPQCTIVLSANGFEGQYNKSVPMWVGRARDNEYSDTLRAVAMAYVQAISRYREDRKM